MMFFNRKGKPRGSMRFVIIRDDNDVNVQQWSLSHGSFIVTSILIFILCAVLLSFTAELMTRYLYQAKLRDIRDNNASLTSVFLDLQTGLSDIQNEMKDLEEKDKALRTYANLPPIDQDIRQVGVGGYTKTKKPSLSELFPGIEEKINNIEMDISELSRKVRLEKESYTAIYNTIKDNSQKLTSIPSIRPLNGGYLNTGIGYRNDPFTGEKRFHHGLDISANRGTAVYATANGKVVSAGKMGNYGKTIKINHGYGYHTFYAHLHEISVQRGQKILRGDIIGQVGNTGRSTASHLHYEVHYLGTPQDPEHYFLARDLR